MGGGGGGEHAARCRAGTVVIPRGIYNVGKHCRLFSEYLQFSMNKMSPNT